MDIVTELQDALLVKLGLGVPPRPYLDSFVHLMKKNVNGITDDYYEEQDNFK